MSRCAEAVERACPGRRWPGVDWEERLERYLDELERWNRSIQMVRYDRRDELAERHVADAAVVASALLERGAASGRAIDVGSGGGIPGVVVAVLLPELDVVALEPVHKKRAFLAHAGRALGLGNFSALAERDETHGRCDYDVAMSRAVWPARDWLSRGARLVGDTGLVVAMEGKQRASLPEGAERIEYRLGDRERALVLWRPRG